MMTFMVDGIDLISGWIIGVMIYSTGGCYCCGDIFSLFEIYCMAVV